MLEQNAVTPLYEQLKTEIKKEIAGGTYRSGDKMPSELELEEAYGVSRITVRRAVKELCEEGILMRKQGKGTFVMSGQIQSRFDTLMGFHDSLSAIGRKTDTKLLGKTISLAQGSRARDMAVPEGTELLLLDRLMMCDGKPVMIDHCYLPLNRYEGIMDHCVGDISVYRILQNVYHVELARFYKVLKVRKATKEECELLRCAKGDPVFDIFKIAYDPQGIPAHISVTILSGDNTSYVISSDEVDQMSHQGIKWTV